MGILSQKMQIEKELQQDFKDFVAQKDEKTKQKQPQQVQPKEELVCEPC